MKQSLCQGSGPELVHCDMVWSLSSGLLRQMKQFPVPSGTLLFQAVAPRGDKDAALSRPISCVEYWH